MSWRRFSALFRNLSPYGAVASRVEEIKRKPKEDITVEEGRAQATAFFASVLSTGGKSSEVNRDGTEGRRIVRQF